MPRTTASRDDAVVGQTVPSTTVDPSKGTGTTQPASSSNVHDAEDTGGKATPRVWCQETCCDEGIYVSSLNMFVDLAMYRVHFN